MKLCAGRTVFPQNKRYASVRKRIIGRPWTMGRQIEKIPKREEEMGEGDSQNWVSRRQNVRSRGRKVRSEASLDVRVAVWQTVWSGPFRFFQVVVINGHLSATDLAYKWFRSENLCLCKVLTELRWTVDLYLFRRRPPLRIPKNDGNQSITGDL